MVTFSSKTVYCGKSFGRSMFGGGGRNFVKIGNISRTNRKFYGTLELSWENAQQARELRVKHAHGEGQFCEFFFRGHLVDGEPRAPSDTHPRVHLTHAQRTYCRLRVAIVGCLPRPFGCHGMDHGRVSICGMPRGVQATHARTTGVQVTHARETK